MFNFKLWLKGIYAALIGGAATTAANALSDPAAIGHPKELATAAGVGAVVAGLGYLKTHPPVEPLPDELEAVAALGIGAAVGTIEKKLPKSKR